MTWPFDFERSDLYKDLQNIGKSKSKRVSGPGNKWWLGGHPVTVSLRVRDQEACRVDGTRHPSHSTNWDEI